MVWARPSAAGSVARIYQDIKPLNLQNKSFYAANSGLVSGGVLKGGIYIGLQRDQSVANVQNATFSLFAQANDPTHLNYRRLDSPALSNTLPNVCNYGADAGTGVSCRAAYSWVDNTAYRLSVDVVLSGDPNLCPTGTPNFCFVYYGYVGLTSQPFSRYLIGRFSVNASIYGDLSGLDDFVETFAGWCVTKPDGRFDLPYYLIQNVNYNSPSATSFDVGAAVFPNCGRSYFVTFTSASLRIV